MKSSKQRRSEIVAKRKARAEKAALKPDLDPRGIGLTEAERLLVEEAPCNPALLASSNSYGVPEFVARGYYIDLAFECANCRTREIWRATQQKWWYEVAKGDVQSGAKLCRDCRRAERARRDEARRVHLEGVAKKLERKKVT